MRGLTVLLAVCTASSAWAHPLGLSTARVTLRDAHAEVLVDFDPIAVLSGAAPDATRLAVASDAELAAEAGAMRARIAASARLEVDGVETSLVLRSFPELGELRALAAQASAGVPASERRAVIVFETTRPLLEVRALRVELSPSLGPVMFSFVQPSTRLAQPGEPASFEVLRPARAAAEAHGPVTMAGLAVAAMALGLTRLRRRPLGGRP